MGRLPRPLLNLIGPDGKRYPVKVPTRNQHRTFFRPYSAEIGYLATSWNQLHYNLLSIFTLVLGAKNQNYAQALWYSTDNDFAQRKMLRAILKFERKSVPHQRLLKTHQLDDLLWVLNQIDEKLRHDRNNAMH